MRIDVRADFRATSPFKVIEYDMPYSNLVWNRRYYDFGEFQMQIDPALYDPASWAFVTTPDSDEIGLIQKVEYTSENGGRLILSGLFAESVLDNAIVYLIGQTMYCDSTPDLCERLFNVYYSNATVAQQFPLDVLDTTISGGESGFVLIEHGDGLGSKIQNMLNNVNASYSVKANASNTKGVFHIWRGIDRSASQSARQQVVFNSEYGDIYDVSIVRDVSAVKNRAIVEYEALGGDTLTQLFVDSTDPLIPANAGFYKETYVKSDFTDSDATAAQIQNAARQAGMSALYDAKPVIDVDATVFDSSGLRRDYDLGDVVTLQIPEIGIAYDTRIVETTEIFNSDGKTVELGFGNKRISLMERAIKTWLYL